MLFMHYINFWHTQTYLGTDLLPIKFEEHFGTLLGGGKSCPKLGIPYCTYCLTINNAMHCIQYRYQEYVLIYYLLYVSTYLY